DIEAEIEITDAIKPLEGLIIHLGKIVKGKIKTGDTVEAVLDLGRRRDITRSHTATHILHKVLREVLGEQVKQAGSLVEPGCFRFDFNHLKALKERELNRLEELINAAIRDNFAVLTAITTVEEAKTKGAMALFGEKYASKVRMIMITAEGPEAPADAFSLELCGGTHVKATGEIGLVKLTAETSIASGVRRIEALVGEEAYKFIKKEEETLNEAAGLLKTNREETLIRITKMLQRTKDLEKELAQLKDKMAVSQSEELAAEITEKAGIKMMIKKLPSMDREALRTFGDKIKDKLKSGVIVLGSVTDDNIALLVMVTDDLIKRGLHAGKIIKEVAALAGGAGGGKPELAQAGAKDVTKLDGALAKAPEIIEKMMKHK
ncbi:MAG: DHHA1 domain-containing protein, partial [bacterium]